MTEAQWKAYLPTLEGQQVVKWQGWVVEVDAKSGGRYELWVDMDSPDDPFSTQDVYFPVPEDIALTINKDQEVVFSGIIESVTEFMGSISFRLEDVTFELR